MKINTLNRIDIRRILKNAGPFFLLAALIWVTHFWHSADFGLYEDDYNMVSRGMAMSGQELWEAIRAALLNFEGGKPFHASFVYLLSFLGSNLGDITVLYWFGYLLVTLNAFLFYLLLKRVVSGSFAFLGAIAYTLFSADTTQAFLTIALGFQPSIMFLLLAMHSYLSNKHLISYFLVLGVLLTYEVPYPVFLAAPLLRKNWDEKLLKRTIQHALILGGILGLTIGVRYLVGEPRITGLGFPEVITVPIKQMVLGPYISLRSYIHRPYLVLRSLDAELGIVLAVSFLYLTLAFSWLRFGIRGDVPHIIDSLRSLNFATVKDRIRKKIFPIELSEEQRRFFRFGFTGFLMLILAYPFTFTVSALTVSGRNTRVHFAAIFGASILCACVSWLIMRITASYGKKWVGVFILAAYFALFVGFGFVVQNEYVLAWQYQREFWSELLPLIPDAEEGTVIIVDPSGLKDTIHIGANFWSLPRMLDQIYQFPDEWDEPPRVFRLVPNWREYIVRAEGLFQLKDFTTHAPASHYKNIESSTCILIEKINGRWVRRTGPLVFDGIEFPLKTLGTTDLPSFPRGFLFDYLIQELSY
ncbi:MAG: hypothetical protein AMJ88_14585 [Anaerolineae bacterium SM23_ 63]|nr:MAG: hypothetical protein AMJ88_14585 [Anaerolineae bacterium SM23_ 63]